jgi:energy-coupling factor transport system substrate-specific component
VRKLGRILLFFSGKELTVLAAVGLASGLVDHQALSLLFASVARINSVMLFNYYLAQITGGPLFGDFLQDWLEYGGVLAAFLVRKPAAGTIALTINGMCQVFVYGTHYPHLWYGFSGLGADIAFALFRFKRYDALTVGLSGASSGLFWYPIVWFTHGVYLYPPSFILPDFVTRLLASAFGDGLLGAALALIVLRVAGRRRGRPFASWSGGAEADARRANIIGLGMISLGVLVIVLTYSLPPVSNFFLSIGPKIPGGLQTSEEYNLGYVIGTLLIFLDLTMLGFWKLRSRYSSLPE